MELGLFKARGINAFTFVDVDFAPFGAKTAIAVEVIEIELVGLDKLADTMPLDGAT